ncbi:MAG: ATP-binding cassette domain-containing protein [Promethearchaeota archaeon]
MNRISLFTVFKRWFGTNSKSIKNRTIIITISIISIGSLFFSVEIGQNMYFWAYYGPLNDRGYDIGISSNKNFDYSQNSTDFPGKFGVPINQSIQNVAQMNDLLVKNLTSQYVSPISIVIENINKSLNQQPRAYSGVLIGFDSHYFTNFGMNSSQLLIWNILDISNLTGFKFMLSSNNVITIANDSLHALNMSSFLEIKKQVAYFYEESFFKFDKDKDAVIFVSKDNFRDLDQSIEFTTYKEYYLVKFDFNQKYSSNYNFYTSHINLFYNHLFMEFQKNNIEDTFPSSNYFQTIVNEIQEEFSFFIKLIISISIGLLLLILLLNLKFLKKDEKEVYVNNIKIFYENHINLKKITQFNLLLCSLWILLSVLLLIFLFDIIKLIFNFNSGPTLQNAINYILNSQAWKINLILTVSIVLFEFIALDPRKYLRDNKSQKEKHSKKIFEKLLFMMKNDQKKFQFKILIKYVLLSIPFLIFYFVIVQIYQGSLFSEIPITFEALLYLIIFIIMIISVFFIVNFLNQLMSKILQKNMYNKPKKFLLFEFHHNSPQRIYILCLMIIISILFGSLSILSLTNQNTRLDHLKFNNGAQYTCRDIKYSKYNDSYSNINRLNGLFFESSVYKLDFYSNYNDVDYNFHFFALNLSESNQFWKSLNYSSNRWYTQFNLSKLTNNSLILFRSSFNHLSTENKNLTSLILDFPDFSSVPFKISSQIDEFPGINYKSNEIYCFGNLNYLLNYLSKDYVQFSLKVDLFLSPRNISSDEETTQVNAIQKFEENTSLQIDNFYEQSDYQKFLTFSYLQKKMDQIFLAIILITQITLFIVFSNLTEKDWRSFKKVLYQLGGFEKKYIAIRKQANYLSFGLFLISSILGLIINIFLFQDVIFFKPRLPVIILIPALKLLTLVIIILIYFTSENFLRRFILNRKRKILLIFQKKSKSMHKQTFQKNSVNESAKIKTAENEYTSLQTAKEEDKFLKTSFDSLKISESKVTFPINANEIFKIYNDGNSTLPVIQGVSFAIKKSSLTCFIGVSGSGKTTLLDMIIGNRKPTSGEITYYFEEENKSEEFLDSFSNSANTKFDYYDFEIIEKNIGFVSQTPKNQLLSEFQVDEFLNLILSENNRKQKTQSNLKLDKLLGYLNLGSIKNQKIKHLSGGEQQRLAILCAIARKSKIIILDEPTSALDYDNSKNLMNLLRNLAKELQITLLFSTHSAVVAEYADNIYEIYRGSFRRSGRYKDLKNLIIDSKMSTIISVSRDGKVIIPLEFLQKAEINDKSLIKMTEDGILLKTFKDGEKNNE